jgi:cysteine synthase A
LRSFRRAYEELGIEGRLVAVDMDPLAAALQVAGREEARGARIAVVLPDSGERYVSTPFFAPEPAEAART